MLKIILKCKININREQWSKYYFINAGAWLEASVLINAGGVYYKFYDICLALTINLIDHDFRKVGSKISIYVIIN